MSLRPPDPAPDVISAGHQAGPVRLAWVAAVIVLAAALAGAALAAVHYRGEVAALRSAAAQPAGTITVINENELPVQLSQARSALLAIRWLRAGRGPVTAWLDLVAVGLPGGIDYTVAAGDCRNGHPHGLGAGSSSGASGGVAGIVELSVDSLRADPASVLWVRVATVTGVQLGGVRGSFWPPGNVTAIRPGQPSCPS